MDLFECLCSGLTELIKKNQANRHLKKKNKKFCALERKKFYFSKLSAFSKQFKIFKLIAASNIFGKESEGTQIRILEAFPNGIE